MSISPAVAQEEIYRLKDDHTFKYGFGVEVKIRTPAGTFTGKIFDVGSRSVVLGLADDQKVIDLMDVQEAWLVLPSREESLPLIDGKTDFEAMKECLEHIVEDDDALQSLPAKQAAEVLKRFSKE